MRLLDTIRSLWEHVIWADGRILEAVASAGGAPDQALREFAHVVGSEEVWLARLEGRSPGLAVWPSVSLSELEALVRETHRRWNSYVSGLSESDLKASVTYTNSAGREFTNVVGDVLLHVALHGQYHRGKVNLLLREAGLTPAPVDYIAFVRGAPAATEADARSDC